MSDETFDRGIANLVAAILTHATIELLAHPEIVDAPKAETLVVSTFNALFNALWDQP